MDFNNGWKTDENCYVRHVSGMKLMFSEAMCKKESVCTAVSAGIRKTYSEFDGLPNLKIVTLEMKRFDGIFQLEISVENDPLGEIDYISWPGAMLPRKGMKRGSGATILPATQGIYLPDDWKRNYCWKSSPVLEEFLHMPFIGQIADKGEKGGYMVIFDTPWDEAYSLEHKPGEWTQILPQHQPSLGNMRYKRSLLYIFDEISNQTIIAKHYRKYVKEHGTFVTLKEKEVKNPKVAKLYGTPVVTVLIAWHAWVGGKCYIPDRPSANNFVTSFKIRTQQIRRLKRKGVGQAYIHIDGWGKNGFERMHPDVLPPYENAGGTQGLKELSEECRKLGYLFGLHDQYRSYYYDAQSFDFDNAVLNMDGTNPYDAPETCTPMTYLCEMLAPDYVRRNYEELCKMGISVDCAYLDSYSEEFLNECFNPLHQMTRRQCVEKRRECFRIINEFGAIPSSVQAVDAMIPELPICFRTPFISENKRNPEASLVGIPIPLFNLVYHECIIIPWITTKLGGYSGLLHAMLNGGTVYFAVEERMETLIKIKPVLKLHKRLVNQEMVSHCFVDGNYHMQRTVYSDGTTVTVDYDRNAYRVEKNGKRCLVVDELIVRVLIWMLKVLRKIKSINL